MAANLGSVGGQICVHLLGYLTMDEADVSSRISKLSFVEAVLKTGWKTKGCFGC